MEPSDMFSATDISSFLACPHTATLKQAESRGEVKKPFRDNPALDLLRKLGEEHEQRHLAKLRQDGLQIVEIDHNVRWVEGAAETAKAMQVGADVIYQAVFLDTNWGGRPDFLTKVSSPSALGDWAYEVVETKLARSTKAAALVQLCFYSDMLSLLQGVNPQWVHVVLGGLAEPERFALHKYAAYFRKVRADFQQAWQLEADTYPEPAEHCDVCSWFSVCDKRRRADDHLSFVAGITRNQRKALVERGVSTLAGLASLSLPVKPKIERIGAAALQRIREQARLQMQGREDGYPLYELLDEFDAGQGLASLPAPCPADIFLDFEANPYILGDGLEYLTGFVTLDDQNRPQYQALWALDRAEEKKAFESFISMVMERWHSNPGMHIYHYAPYEPTAIKRLAGRHGCCIEELDQLLRAEVFVDLYRAVRQGLRASVESYSIKRLEPLYDFTRTVPLRDANGAQQAFEAALALASNHGELSDLLKVVEGYNQDDCVSAFRLREWLEERRTELGAESGKPLPRPKPKEGEPSENLAAELDRVAQLKKGLLDALPADGADWTDENRACWLLAQMLEYHRREEKSFWWEYYRLCELSDDELQEDKNALGGLEYIGPVEQVKRSIVHRYCFPPQDHKIKLGRNVRDPRTRKGVGEVGVIDEITRTIDIKRGITNQAPHPTALIPHEHVGTEDIRESLCRLASWVADNSIIGAGPYQAARNLLLRSRPEALKTKMDTVVGNDDDLTKSAKDMVRSLAKKPSVLPIQGPPGSGKTFTGARMILELVRNGKRVGVTAVSHKVISHLLEELCDAAEESKVKLRCVQRVKEVDDGSGCQHRLVTLAGDNPQVLAALRDRTAAVAAGTAWLWSREEMSDSVDVLFVDEAGQMSLANLLAMSQAAKSLVLLGDPQQLDQPQKGLHPPGAEVSALSHLLNGRATIGDDQGIFLAETRRLHPDVCAFTSEVFYDGRLMARPENGKQRLNANGQMDGTGLRFVPVQHSGNQSESPEEADAIRDLVEELLECKATWTDKESKTNLLGLDDILIVAPYNAQVALLTERLPGARIGTVDKFQGQQAPVVVYSMTTSTPDDAPRGMEFLYSSHRLNVATSRARCVAVMVGSPALFNVQCKTPRQMELANAFCRYLEMARSGVTMAKAQEA
jgi:predicted RecB family nuclease